MVVTNLGVFDFDTPDHSMRLRSVHPGVTVDEVVEATGFALRHRRRRRDAAPTDDELRLIREVLDPDGHARQRRDRRPPSPSSSASTIPIVQTGMGWVAGARLASATSAAGGLGILAAATMTLDELRRAIDEVQGPHRRARSA